MSDSPLVKQETVLDIDLVVGRLTEVGKRKAGNLSAISEALRPLLAFRPWQQQLAPTLVEDYLRTIERLDPSFRPIVRYTLGLSDPKLSLTQRRAKHWGKDNGGGLPYARECYALARSLAAMICEEAARPPSYQLLSGIRIATVTQSWTINHAGVEFAMSLVGSCERVERLLVAPGPAGLDRGLMDISVSWHKPAEEPRHERYIRPLDAFWVDPTKPGAGEFVCVPLPVSLSVGDGIQVDICGSNSTGGLDGRYDAMTHLGWSALGSELSITLTLSVDGNVPLNDAWGVCGLFRETSGRLEPSSSPRIDYRRVHVDGIAEERRYLTIGHAWQAICRDTTYELRWHFGESPDMLNQAEARDQLLALDRLRRGV